MRSVVTSLVLAVLLLAPLAGCLGPAAEVAPATDGAPAPEQPAGGNGGATIEGVVVTEDIVPIPNAVVRLARDGALVDQTTTDEQGRYALVGLEPGEYVVQASAPCCKESVARLQLDLGATRQMNMRLAELPTLVPYVLEFEWTGFIGCAVRVDAPYGNPDPEECQALDSNTETRYEFVIEPGLQTIVVAMVWDQVTTSAVEDLRLMMYKHPSTAQRNRFFFEAGTSPIEVRHGPGDAIGGEALTFTAMEKPWDVRFRVWPGGTANVVYQQPFTVHYHLYYIDPAPDGASALPG